MMVNHGNHHSYANTRVNAMAIKSKPSFGIHKFFSRLWAGSIEFRAKLNDVLSKALLFDPKALPRVYAWKH